MQNSLLTYMLTYMCRPDVPFHVLGGSAEDKEKEGDQFTLSLMCFSITTSVLHSENSSRSLCPCWRPEGENLVGWSCSCMVREERHLGWRKQGVGRRRDSGQLLLVKSIRNKTLMQVIIVRGKIWPRKLALKLCISSPKLRGKDISASLPPNLGNWGIASLPHFLSVSSLVLPTQAPTLACRGLPKCSGLEKFSPWADLRQKKGQMKRMFTVHLSMGIKCISDTSAWNTTNFPWYNCKKWYIDS